MHGVKGDTTAIRETKLNFVQMQKLTLAFQEFRRFPLEIGIHFCKSFGVFHY